MGKFSAQISSVLVAVFLCSTAHGQSTSQPAVTWDNSRYMHVADVHTGMTGYGLSVFSGTKIEKFDVQIIDVVKNMVNPKRDVIIVSCNTPLLQHVGPIEGMSGSPIFLYGDDDPQHLRPRMIGAFAYGWEWVKDPVGGVQPIEYMLDIPAEKPVPEAGAAAPANAPAHTNVQISRPRWSLRDVAPLPGFSANAAGFSEKDALDGRPRLRPLVTPLLVSGFSADAAKRLAPMWSACGMDLLQAGSSSAATRVPAGLKLEPGSTLVVPIVTGDMEMTALGTCTEVIGNRIYGFGHEFNNEGPIRLPMGTGTVALVVAELSSSFKLGSLAHITGTLTNDQTVGVAGNVGEDPPLVPVEMKVHYADGSLDQTYHCLVALHSKFTPMGAAATLVGALTGVKNIPTHHTLDYHLTVDFIGGRSVTIDNVDVDGEAGEVAQELALPIQAAAENPYQDVLVKQITGTINVSAEPRESDLTSVTLPKLKFEPGDQIKGFVNYRPWHQGEQTLPFTFEVPRDLPDGQYQLVVSDWQRYFTDQLATEPFRFSAESIDELFSVVKDFESIRHNALYLRLLRQADGVAVGRTALPRLPSGMRQALLQSGRSNLTAFVSSDLKIVPEDQVFSGAAEFALTIKRESSKQGKPTTQP